MAKKGFFILFLTAAVLMSNSAIGIANADKLEKIFSEDFDRVWDATIAVVTEKGFATHPHKKMKIKKKKGRIKTPEWRYFKIWSASPVVQKDYKDSYKINLKKIEIEVPLSAEPEAAKPEGTPPAVDPAAKPAASSEKQGGEVAPPPVKTITKIKVIIKRKFLVHNDETRKWVKGDPKKEMVGYPVEEFMKEIEAKLLSDQAPTVDKSKVANLNIVPPPISKGPPPILK